MTKKKGRDVIKKISPLLIPVDCKDPKYMSLYMRVKRNREKIDPPTLSILEKEANELLRKLSKALEIP